MSFREIVQSRLERFPRLRKMSAGLGFLALATLISFSLFATAPKPVTPVNVEKAWPVSVQTIAPENLAPVFSSYGKVESNTISEISVPVAAEVASVRVREGDWAAAGDVLMTLRADELQAIVKAREADLRQQSALLDSIQTEYRMMKETDQHYESVYRLAQKKLQRQEELLEKRMISQALLDEAIQEASGRTIEYQGHVRALADFPSRIAQQEAQVAQAEAQLQLANINLGHAEIRAPFSGPVLEMFTAVGDRTAPGTALLSIADASEFIVRAPVPNIYIDRFRTALEEGQSVNAAVSLNGVEFSLPLDRLSNNVRDGQSGLDAFFRFDALLPQRLPEIGRVVDLNVTMPVEANVVALPVQSIYENNRIYQVKNNRLEAIEVQRVGDYLGASGQFQVLVRSRALQAGQDIITTQLPRAISGLLVEAVNAGI